VFLHICILHLKSIVLRALDSIGDLVAKLRTNMNSAYNNA